MAAVKNASYSVVAVAPSPAASGTTLTVSSGHGSRFAVGRPVTIYPAGEPPLGDNFEIGTVTDITGDVLTLTRAQESTAARTIVVGDQIAQTLTAAGSARIQCQPLPALAASPLAPAAPSGAGTAYMPPLDVIALPPVAQARGIKGVSWEMVAALFAHTL